MLKVPEGVFPTALKTLREGKSGRGRGGALRRFLEWAGVEFPAFRKEGESRH